MPARPSNEKGFWESLDVQQLNDELLAALSSRWDDPVTVSTDQLAPAQLASFHDRAAKLLARDFSQSTIFVLKDPRICRLFAFWRDALQGFGCDLKVVIPFREPLDVAASLVARNAMDATKAQVVWLHHMLKAEMQTRPVPRYILHFDALLADWKQSMEDMAEQLELQFPKSHEEASPEIDAFLDPALRHHHYQPEEAKDSPFETLELVDATRKAVLRLAKNIRDRGALSSMDKLNQRFRSAEQLFSASLTEARRDALTLAERVARQQRELEETRSTKESSVAELEGLRSSEQRVAEDLRTAQLQHQEEMLRWQQTVNELADAVAHRDARLEQSQQQVRNAEDKLAFEQKLVRNAERHMGSLIRLRLRDVNQITQGQLGGLGAVRSLLKPLPISGWQQELITLGRPPTERLNTESGQRFSTVQWLRMAQRLLSSGLFSSRWFLLTATEPESDGLHPIWQWLAGGWRQRADPNPLFDTRWYLMNANEVRERDIDPLLHYLLRGARENRSPSPLFDGRWYLAKSPDVGLRRDNALSHFLLQSLHKGRAPNPLLDPAWYRARYSDVARSGLSATEHFVLLGGPMGRDPSPRFDSRWYWEQHPDVAEHGMTPLAHYLAYGKSEQRAIRRVKYSSSTTLPHHGAEPQKAWYPGKLRVDSDAARALQLTESAIIQAREELGDTAPLAFSIIMPTWNRRGSISRAIDSVLAQSYQGWELLICDDGSTDGTQDYVEREYATQIESGRIRYLPLPHGGVSAARNAGLASASGDWIAYLDSDNRWHPHFLLMMTAGLGNQSPRPETAYAALHVQMQDLSQEFIRARPFDWNHLLQGNYIDLNIFVHTRKLYQEQGGFDENLNRLVDWDLILRFTREHPPLFVPHVLADYFIAKSLNNITLTRSLSENERQIRRKHAATP